MTRVRTATPATRASAAASARGAASSARTAASSARTTGTAARDRLDAPNTTQARAAASKADPAWTKARATLIAHPTEELPAVGKRLGLSAAQLKSLIAHNGGPHAIWSERDRAIAERLATLAEQHPDAGSFRELARLAQGALPGLEDFHIPKLKRRHPDLLGELSARGMHAPLPPAARARIAELALAHPTLDYAALAELFAHDSALAGVLKWSEAEVTRLREPSRIVPSERKREAALVELATAHLAKAKGDLDDAIAALAKAHPGVEREQLVALGAHHPPLAKHLRRLADASTASTASAAGTSGSRASAAEAAITIDRATARKLDLGPAIMTRALAATEDGLVSRLSAALAHIERTAGDDDGVLAPRDLAASKLTPELAQVMARVYQDLGKKVHPLADITAALPAAIAAIAEKTRRDATGDDLHRRASEETIALLSRAYREEVIEGGGTQVAFHASRKIVSKVWQRIRDTVPAAFPAPATTTADPARLDAISGLYRQLLDGELTTGGFYKRAHVTAPELRLLQASDPERFPRPAGTPSWKTVVGRREAQALDVADLAQGYRTQVLTGEVGLGEFLRARDVSKHRFAALRAEHPKQFPSLGRWGDKTPDDVLAKAIGRAARTAFERDVLVDVPEIIAQVNATPALVELIGTPLNRSRYEALRKKFPHHFPAFRKPELILPVLAAEVRALLEADPTLTPVGITARMREAHPSFRLTRVYQLREAYPDLVPGQAPRPVIDREADAKVLADRMRAEPGRSLPELADDLSAISPRFTADYLRRLRKTFARSVFSDAAIAYKARPIARESVVAAELYALAVRLAPPGSNEAELSRAIDALLEARGIPGYGGARPAPGLTKAMTARHGGVEAQNARTVAEIAAEYAAAAPKGATAKSIFDAILADYPSLDRYKLTTYEKLWADSPPAALKPFVKHGELTLRGLGKTIDEPRYLGGWDIERALLAPAASDRTRAAPLAELAAHARMPLTLPLLDKVIADLDGKKPLEHKNLLWVTHVLASTYALSVALRQAGASASSTIVVGTPYGTNATAREALAGDGFDVRKPALDPQAYRHEVKKAIDAMVKKHLANHEPIVVLDDGGLVAEILRSDPAYAAVRGAFKIVEQTTRGITAAEQDTVDLPVINVARSKSKIAEGALIGRAVAAKVLQGLRRVGKSLDGTRVTVVGYGTIGAQIADQLRREGAQVTVVEPSQARAKQAAKDGFTVASKAAAFPESAVVIGATGHTSIELADLKRLPAGAVIASASSKRLEIDMPALEVAASSRRSIEADSPLVTLPTRAYALGSREITVLGDGWPINFDGDVEDIPAEEIQLTRAVMLAGAIQAASVKPHRTQNKGVIPLDPKLDESVLSGFRTLMRGRKEKAPIGDPDKWADALRTAAATVMSAI